MEMLPNWRNRPITIAYLFNPAFCGEVINRFTKAYIKEKATIEGIPFILALIVLPLVLHQEIRNKLPKTTGKSLRSWLSENQEIKIQIPELIKIMVPHSKEAIMFLLAYRIIKINNNGNIDSFEKNAKGKLEGAEVKECLNKAEFLGKWLAKNGTYQSIIISLGIKP